MIRTVATAAFAAAAASLAEWKPVSDLQVELYTGRWYQMYADAAVDLTFENSSYCVTADYGLNPNGTVSVLNYERQFSVDGPERIIQGWALAANASQPGQLTVHLQGTGAFGAPYWVFELGPIGLYPDAGGRTAFYNGTPQYAYSVVSDPFLLTLFVLARNTTEFTELYQDAVLASLKAAGYTSFLNTPVATVQQGCTYW
jgi:apolipoprotein D and lipocalin family protein